MFEMLHGPAWPLQQRLSEMRLSKGAVARTKVSRRSGRRVLDTWSRSQVKEHAGRFQHADDLVHLALDVCDRLWRWVLLVEQTA